MRKTLTPVLVLFLVATVGLTGCATKKYVDEQISSFGQVTNTKIHEVQDATEGNQKAISDLSAKQDALWKPRAEAPAASENHLHCQFLLHVFVDFYS